MKAGMERLAEQVREGNARASARALSEVENRGPGCDALLAELFSSSQAALRIGVTGAPGAGKSTLVDRIARRLRAAGRSVGVIAVDPTSPFSGGAILGDRVRMQSHDADGDVFIRSMATRGALGGLAPAVGDAITVLEASGRDVVLIETVGVGQAEVDVVELTEIVALVLTPSMGDDIQAAKAGIMEIADVYVLNKADQPGVERLERQLLATLSLLPEGEPRPPIVRTVATTGDGVEELAAVLKAPPRKKSTANYWRRRLRDRIAEGLLTAVEVEQIDRAAERVAAGELNPYDFVAETLGRAK